MDHQYISEDVVGRRFYERNFDQEVEEVDIDIVSVPDVNILKDILTGPDEEALKPRRQSCTDRDTLLGLGLWDVVYDEGFLMTLRTERLHQPSRSHPGDPEEGEGEQALAHQQERAGG